MVAMTAAFILPPSAFILSPESLRRPVD